MGGALLLLALGALAGGVGGLRGGGRPRRPRRSDSVESLTFLAQASVCLASSADCAKALGRVAQLAASRLADWCLIELEDPLTGGLSRVAAAHARPERTELVRRLLPERQETRPQAHGRSLRPARGRGGGPELVEGERLVQALARSEDEVRLLAALGCRCALLVPLLSRGRALGVLLLVSADPRRAYRRDELRVAEELARRCATSVDNARLSREAQEAIRARDEFLSIASHELKTPLTSLGLQLQALRRASSGWAAEGVLPRRWLAKLEGADRQVRRLARLTDELLDISRLRLGRPQLTVEQVDLGQLAAERVAHFRDELPPGVGPLELTVAAPAVGCWDRGRLEQVLTSLLSNAVKYGEGRRVRVTVEGRGGSAFLTVRDEGIGIPLDHQVRIFERFERAASPQHFSGLGLGLYLVRQIVEAHGGSVRVRSRPGAGSAFTVQLPERVPADDAEPGPGPRRAAGAGEGWEAEDSRSPG